MTGKRPTLADVAKRAGTSTAVVSYVLNNGPRPVSGALRAKVEETLDELGYRPDRHAQALRRPRRWRQIGLVVPDLTMPLFAAFVGGVESEARARDHLTMIGNTRFDPDREYEFARSFADVGIDGLIVVAAVNASAMTEFCAQARIPLVLVHNSRGHTDAPIVGADHVRAGQLAARHLHEEHECDRMVFVGGFTEEDVKHGDRETVKQRLEGVNSVTGSAAEVIRTDLTAAGAYRSVSTYLREQKTTPQGMVIGTFGQAAAVIRAVTDAGLRVPEDIRIVGFDAGAAGDYAQISLSTVQQPIEAITRRALDSLFANSGASVNQVPHSTNQLDLRLGESCGCASRAPWPSAAP